MLAFATAVAAETLKRVSSVTAPRQVTLSASSVGAAPCFSRCSRPPGAVILEELFVRGVG
jgi:hypothetical protein